MGLLFCLTGHMEKWPVARGGSKAISNALASYLTSLGGRIHTGTPVRSLSDLPAARVFLFDTDPRQLATLAEPVLPRSYLRRLGRYRYGPGAYCVAERVAFLTLGGQIRSGTRLRWF